MRDIPLGAKGTATLRVKPEHLANQFKDAMLPQVFATPDDGAADGERRAQRDPALSRAGRKRGRHRDRHAAPGGDAGRPSR